MAHLGIESNDLTRLSVGLEDPAEDILANLGQALKAAVSFKNY